MSNMSYCRFENTLNDLRDCYRNFDSEELSDSETIARQKLVELCQEIIEVAEDLDLIESNDEG